MNSLDRLLARLYAALFDAAQVARVEQIGKEVGDATELDPAVIEDFDFQVWEKEMRDA